jgi:1,4-alpha-glucan branching enzyme
MRVYNPGDFNNWGNNSAGRIPLGDSSEMVYDADLDEYLYTIPLSAGQTHQYKVHFQFDDSGSDWLWISDPYHDRTNPQDNNNSVVTIRDPMVFQPARKLDETGSVVERVSAGIFGTQDVSEITFEINGVAMDGLPFFDSASRIFQYTLPSPVPSTSQFKLVATDVLGGTDSVTVGFLPPQVVDEPAPQGIRDGINLRPSPSEVTLSLFAPGKDFVHVIGDFNDWEVSDGYLMKRDSVNADSIRWWITLTSLTPGVEYAFQYLVDGQIRVADPYAHKLLDPANDPFLGDVYPGLKPYPVGQTEQMVGVFSTLADEFAWTEWERPAQKDLVIYELLIRDFVSDHRYSTLTDTLDYLQRLGVNAIELMPINEFNGNISWGYNPAFHLAPDKYYGPAEDLKVFIDECHKRGISVILDVVYNHATGQSPLVRLYNQSPSGAPATPPSAESIYANPTARHPFNVFADLNHESTATKYWLDRANEYWLTEFNVDGFRFDLSKGFTQVNYGSNVGEWSSYDASRIAILKRMADQIWAVDSTAYVILEHFAEDSEERELAEYRVGEGHPGMMLWNNKNFNYNEATMGYHDSGKSNFATVYYGRGGREWTQPNLVSYMESHDEQWLMFKNIAFGACERSPLGGSACDPSLAENFGTYNVREWNIALDRMKMAGAFFFTVPGPKMMWQFGELGYGYGPDGRECLRPGDELGDCPSGTPSRTDRKPIRWEYRGDPLRERLYKAWSAIINLRRNHEVFTSTDTNVDLSVGGPVKRIKLSHPSMSVVILGNFGVAPASGLPAFHHSGPWYDFFTGEEITVVDQNASIPLAAGEFHIYTNQAVETPESGIITVGVEYGPPEIPSSVALEAVYPNPFRNAAVIRFSLPAPQDARVEVFDILGRRVAAPADGVLTAGIHELIWDASGLASGAYVVRLESAGTVKLKTVVRLN